MACLLFALPFFGLAVPQADTLASQTYFERIDHGLTRFYYDRYYYLVDKDCHYKEIEREGKFDFENRMFVGEVKDYDLNGHLVMEGNYVQGLKEGLFRGYHPSGFVKWETMFEQDKPVDTLRFFYPDGMPYLEYRLEDNSVLLWSYWDQKGRQRVKAGNGRFEVVSEADDTYNPIGYRWVKRKGRVKEGRLDLKIPYWYVFEDGKEYQAGYEEYRNGQFVAWDNYGSGMSTFYHTQIPVMPLLSHVRSELMVGKRCTVDDHVGFTRHVSEEWQEMFAAAVRFRTDETGNMHLFIKDDAAQWAPVDFLPGDKGLRSLSFVLEVDKEGKIQSARSDNNFDTPALAERMQALVEEYGYWIPSWNEDFIDDELTIQIKTFVEPGHPYFVLYDMSVVRKNGS